MNYSTLANRLKNLFVELDSIAEQMPVTEKHIPGANHLSH